MCTVLGLRARLFVFLLYLLAAGGAEAQGRIALLVGNQVYQEGVGPLLGEGRRGEHGSAPAAQIWGVSVQEYEQKADPWPLNPRGELLLGVKLESPEGVANCEEILSVPGLGFAELGPGDLGLALGYRMVPRDPYPPQMREARERVFAACRKNRVPFLEACSPENIIAKLDEGVRVIAGHREETARIGRAHQRRAMPV